MNSAERAATLARLRFVAPGELSPPGGWRFRLIGNELQLRNHVTPTLRLDLLRTEARDLLLTLAMALDEPTAGMLRPSWWARLTDWLARRTWRRKHEVELRFAVKQMAREFEESRGGW